MRKESDLWVKELAKGDELDMAPPIPIISELKISQMENAPRICRSKKRSSQKHGSTVKDPRSRRGLQFPGNRIEQAVLAQCCAAPSLYVLPKIDPT